MDRKSLCSSPPKKYSRSGVKNNLGRPQKHGENTKQKAIRFPLSILDQLQKERRKTENLTDVILRILKKGLEKGE